MQTVCSKPTFPSRMCVPVLCSALPILRRIAGRRGPGPFSSLSVGCSATAHLPGREASALFYSQWLRPARIRAAARHRAPARCDLFSDDEGQTWRHKVIESETFSSSTVGPLNESQYITLYACSSMGQRASDVGCLRMRGLVRFLLSP